jgi:hypothetical protein
MNDKPVKLFLDDIRNPKDVLAYINHPVYGEEWDVVRSFGEFCEYLRTKPFPSLISFDHDLADEHYVHGNFNEYTEKTGYHCAMFLIGWCLDNDLPLPGCMIHSMNPVGTQNIAKLLNHFHKHRHEYIKVLE